MGQLFRIYPLRKTLLLIKTKTGGRYSGVVCHRTTDRVPVPMMFVRGGQEGRDELASICEASLVDITPTILDILGLLPSFNTALQNRPDAVKGHPLKGTMDRILTKAPPMVSGNVCASPITVRLPRISD